jgi:hypothetical protein
MRALISVGHKIYFPADKNLVVGVSRLTRQWSRFRYRPGHVFLQTAQLADLLGQIIPMGQSEFEHYKGSDAAVTLRNLQVWLGAGFTSEKNADWLVGRRLIAGWKSSEMVAFEGLQVSPSKFGLDEDADGSAVCYELWEFDGVLMEMFPTKLSHVPDNTIPDIIASSQNWLKNNNVDDCDRLLTPPAG